MNKLWFRPVAMLMILMLTAIACNTSGQSTPAPSTQNTPTPDVPDNAVSISIIYAPESDLYMPETIAEFNQAYREGRNPITGEPLAQGEAPIYVEGRPGSSGTIMQGIVNAFIAPNNENVQRPTIFSPSVSHWLALANYQVGRQVFDLADSRATANAPVVMAIWQSRLEALQRAFPDEQIGWSHLLEVLNNPQGWAAYGIETDRTTVYYGHTDPLVSSTALSTLIAEYIASATASGVDERRLSLGTVQDTEVQDGVRRIESLIRHYSSRTTEFKEYIAQGPDYLDFVALEENDLIYINQGKTEYQPPEPLVALYPAEGTFWHEHPFAILQADWVSDEQAAAARIFTDFVLSPPIQERILAAGFRPVNPDVAVAYPIVQELGVDPNQPLNVLEVPQPEVIAAVQESWSFVKKQADIWLVIDVSGSMYSNNKLEQAKQAAIAFIENSESNNRIGLITFSSTAKVIVPLERAETNSQALKQAIGGLQADGDTALYDAVATALTAFGEDEENDRIRAVILLSDGTDTASDTPRLDALNLVTAERTQANPTVVIPIAYGGDADINTLNSIARAGNTRLQSGNASDIMTLLELISSYF